MKKEKLTKRALNGLIEDCSVDKTSTIKLELVERTGQNGMTIGKKIIDFRKLEKNKERLRYLLAQTYPFHDTGKPNGHTIAEEFTILSDKTQWTRDPIDLQRLITLATVLELMGPLAQTEFPDIENGKQVMKKIVITDLDWKGKENRIKPVIHEEKTPEDK